MLEFIDKMSYMNLIVIGLLLALAPFFPMPHLVEKLIMLKNGTLVKPLDIFDLLMHSTPLFLLVIKIVRDFIFR